MLDRKFIAHILTLFLVLCIMDFLNANRPTKHRLYNFNHTIAFEQQHSILQYVQLKDKGYKTEVNDERSHSKEIKKKDFFPTTGFRTIDNSYLRNHMPSLDDAQKRTRLKEKELKFYGTALTNRALLHSRSRLKEGGFRQDIIKSFYGSKDNPAKSCRDVFLTDRKAKSGNYYIRTSDDEILMFGCDKEPYYANENISTLKASEKNSTEHHHKVREFERDNTIVTSKGEFPPSRDTNPKGLPVNVVLPNKNAVVMADEPQEIKDLTKDANKIDREVTKNQTKNETNVQETSHDKNKEKEKEGKEKPVKEETKETKFNMENSKDLPLENPRPEPTTPAPTEDVVSQTTKPLPTVQSTTKSLPMQARNISNQIPTTTQQPVPTTIRTPTTPLPPSRPPPTTPVSTVAGNVQNAQHNKQESNPYFPDFPSSNPDANPPPPPPTNREDKGRPPQEPRYPAPPPPPIQDKPPHMVGYGFNGPPHPPPPERNDRFGRPEAPYLPPPPPGRSEAMDRPVAPYRPHPYGYDNQDRDRPRYRPQLPPPPPNDYRENPFGRYPPPAPPYAAGRHLNEENLEFGDIGTEGTSLEKQKIDGNAGDLGDLQNEQRSARKFHQSKSNDESEGLYGRREERPKSPELKMLAKETVENPIERSVSWAFHEGVMLKEHAFNQQYKDFDDMDKAIDKKHSKNQYHPSKPVQENAHVRSWNSHRNDMINKISKEQYDDFEKSTQQIAQDMASKTYREQYAGFESFRNATSNSNASDDTTTNSTSETTNPYETPANNTPSNPNEYPESNDPSNPNEVPTNNTPSNPYEVPANNTPSNPYEVPANNTPSNPYEVPSNNIPENPFEPQGDNAPSNPASATSQSDQSPAPSSTNNNTNATDYYKQYVNTIDPIDNSLPEFPNATAQKSSLENGTQSAEGQLVEPTALTNGSSFSVTTGNLTTLNTNSSMTPNLHTTSAPFSSNTSSKATEMLKVEPAVDNMAMKRGNSIYPESILQTLIRISESLNKQDERTGSKRILEGHSKYQLRQIGGPPNPTLMKVERHGMLKLRNLTGVNEIDDFDNKDLTVKQENHLSEEHYAPEDRQTPEEHQAVEEHQAAEEESANSVAYMVKTGALPLEGVSSKEVVEVLKSILKENNANNTKNVEDSHVTRRQGNDAKIKTIPNSNGLVIPQTKKKFAIDGDVSEEKLMELLGQRVIIAKKKQKELQQKKLISQIKAQALSKREPLMGRFSTADLKEFLYEKNPKETETENKKFTKFLELAKEEIMKNKLKDSAHHLDLEMLTKPNFHQGQLLASLFKIHQSGLMNNGNSHKGLDGARSRKDYTPTISPNDKRKRQNLKHIHDSLFNVQLNMQDLIKMTQKTMDNVPGLTEENQKIDEKTGTSNETIEKIKEEQKAVKEGVNKKVDNETEQNNQGVQGDIQKGRPHKKDYVHDVFSKVRHGAEKVRHKLQHKMTEKIKGRFGIDFDMRHYDVKHTIPTHQKGSQPQLRKSDVSLTDGGDLVTETVRKIQEETKKVEKKVQETVQKAQNDHLKQMNRVFKGQGGILGKVTSVEPTTKLNAEALPGMNRRSRITNKKKGLIEISYLLGNEPTNFHEHLNKTIQPLQSPRSQGPKFSKNSVTFSADSFPQQKNSTPNIPRHSKKFIDGKILGSRARMFREKELVSLHEKLTKLRARRSGNHHHTTMRELIPNAIGEISPSRELPLPATKVKSNKPNQEASQQSDPKPSAQLPENGSLQQLLLLRQKLQQRIDEQLKEKEKDPSTSAEEKKEENKSKEPSTGNIGEVGAVHPNEDTKPTPTSQNEKNNEGENTDKNVPDSGDGSGKNEVGTNLTTKLKSNKKPLNRFEAGLDDVPEATPKLTSKNNKTSINSTNKNSKDLKEDSSTDESLLSKSQSTNNSPLDLELSILNLLNQTMSQTPQKQRKVKPTNHLKQMEELNHKYEQLKLPVDHGELLREDVKGFNRTHRHHHPILPPIQGRPTEMEVESIEMPTIVDATPTESPSEDYLAQRLKLMELSSLLQGKSNGNKGNQENNNDEEKENNGRWKNVEVDNSTSPSTQQEPIAVEEMTIHLQPLPQLQQPSDKIDNNKPEEDTAPTITPAELAKKLLLNNLEQPTTHQQSLPNTQDLSSLGHQQSTAAPQKPIPVELEAKNSSLQAPTSNEPASPQTPTPNELEVQNSVQKPNLAPDKSGNNEIPIIPVPMNSKLGELLYPALKDQKVTHNTTTSVTFDGRKEVVNTNVDGKNYSAILIDQTKQLMEKNKINKQDLMDLLASNRDFDNVRPSKPFDKKNSIVNQINKNEPLMTVNANKRDEKLNRQIDSIHITLENANGQFYLIPDQNEALEKHYVPQKIGLQLVPKKTKS